LQDAKSLLAQFGEDVDRIASSLIGSFGLRHSASETPLSTPLLRWFDFWMRIIDPRPREVLFSDQFPKALGAGTGTALQYIEAAVRAGDDVNP
jgi:hypothetical protein